MNKLIFEIIEKYSGPYHDNDFTLINVSGKDNKKFLQGQLTNDILGLNSKKYLLSSYCTHQGKVISNLQIVVIDDEVLILLPKNIATYFIDKISKYILMSEVKFEINSNAKILSVIGDKAYELLDENKLTSTNACKRINKNDLLINMSTSSLKQCRYIIFDNEKDKNIKYELFKGPYTCLIDLFNLFTRLKKEDIEKFIPQVLNADNLDTVNYKKGCYTGQEVVARTHYLGSVKKHVYLGFLNKANNDEKIIINKDGESVGELIGETFLHNNILLSHCILRDSCNFKDLFVDKSKFEIISMEDTA